MSPCNVADESLVEVHVFVLTGLLAVMSPMSVCNASSSDSRSFSFTLVLSTIEAPSVFGLIESLVVVSRISTRNVSRFGKAF